MDLVSTLITIIVGLIAYGYYNKTKKDSAEAILKNQETKEQLNEISKNISKNEGLLLSEEEKRKQLEEELEKKKNEASKQDLLDDLNKRN